MGGGQAELPARWRLTSWVVGMGRGAGGGPGGTRDFITLFRLACSLKLMIVNYQFYFLINFSYIVQRSPLLRIMLKPQTSFIL